MLTELQVKNTKPKEKHYMLRDDRVDMFSDKSTVLQ